MTDKIIISRKEIERIVKQLQAMNVSIAQSTDDLRALLDKAEVSGEYLDNENCLLEMVRELQAREKVLVELLGECVDTVRNEYNEMLELYSIYPHKQYDIQCQKELLNGIEQALANVRGEVK